MKPGKHQRSKQRCQDLCWKVHDRAQSFVLRSYTILTAYLISPSHGKGLSSSNSSVLYLRVSGMMHCGLGFKYHNFSRLVVSSTEFGQVTVKFRPSHLPRWRLILYPTFYTPLPWQSRISSHNLASRVRAIVCSDNDILCMNYVTNTFLLVGFSVRSKQLLCFVHGQGQKSEQTHTVQQRTLSGFITIPLSQLRSYQTPYISITPTACMNFCVMGITSV